MTQRRLVNLEIHVTHACNLTCEGCAHYSNQGHKGVLSLDEAEQWMRAWCGRLAPRIFSLVGGEPTLHPQLAEFVELAGSCWPEAMVRVLTNGFFLHRHPELPAALARRHGLIEISVHHDSPEYAARVQEIQALMNEWQARHGTAVRWMRSFGMWTRRYRGWGSDMQPFNDGNPRSSWQHCRARQSPQLFEGKLWKCPALAYLPMQQARHPLGPEWQFYLGYQPLDAACTAAQLDEFLGRQEEDYCGMCPAQPEQFAIPSPLIALSTRQRGGSA